MRFTHLHLHSHYSLLDGLSKIDEIVERVKELGMDSVALTDHGVLYGAIEFYQKAKEKGVKPIIGCELYLSTRKAHDKDPQKDSGYFHLLLLAENNIGYQNLLKLVTKAHLEGFYYKPRVDKELLRALHEGLIATSGCLSGEISRAILYGKEERARELIEEYVSIFGKENFFLELQHHPEFPEQEKVNTALRKFAKEFSLPLIVTADSHYPRPEDKEAHDVLLAVQTGSKVDDAERMTMKNADFSIKSAEEIAKDFVDVPEALENTWKIAERCNVTLELGKVVLPEFPLPEGTTATQHLRALAEERFTQFYATDNQEARSRLGYELSVIEKTGFADYFLIVQDFIDFARRQGIPTNTRGSAAGSLVSYILGVTNLDPIHYKLYFERFLNPERIEPPDIDLDVADNRRTEIIDYIREKYGKDHVAQIITFGVMKARLAVRDVTRALNLPYALGDQISRLIPFNFTIDQAIDASGELKMLYDTNPDAKVVIDMARRLEGVVRHASTHAAGIVIAKSPLVDYLPLQQATRSSADIITQYSMYDIGKIGLLKMDVLGLANLTVIKNATRIIKKISGEDIDLDSVGFDDPEVYKLLSRGETVGVFQLESSGMTHFLKELKPSHIEDVVAMVSLYRPGPLDAGMIPEYIARKHGKKKIEYFDPRVEQTLKETYGIIVYQEQLMKIAQDICGFTMAQADTLRKAVGKKIKKLLDEQRERFTAGAIAHGMTKEKATRLWEFVEPFARYGFNKAHAASYARIAYQTAWLKTHYPRPFMAALLTSDFGNLDRIAIEIAECERMGITIAPPNVNRSFVEFGVAPDTGEIIFSLAAIKGVGVGVAEFVQEDRKANGPYTSLENFVERLPRNMLSKKTLEVLAKSGALDSLGERKQILFGADSILKFADTTARQASSQQMGLFGGVANGASLKLPAIEPATKQERLAWERELMGMYISDHPLSGYQALLATATIPIQKLNEAMSGRRVKIGGLLATCKRIITKTGKPMLFSKLEDTTSNIEVVVFPDILEKNPIVWKEDAIVMIEGKVDTRNGDLKIICERVEPLNLTVGAPAQNAYEPAEIA
ncbi:MAG: DNA polymerase III subunit alpha [Parcubacteria group bacterium]|nr:DNA polymerase III subunit alpha [Parcubacteria group bacterium]